MTCANSANQRAACADHSGTSKRVPTGKKKDGRESYGNPYKITKKTLFLWCEKVVCSCEKLDNYSVMC